MMTRQDMMENENYIKESSGGPLQRLNLWNPLPVALLDLEKFMGAKALLLLVGGGFQE